MYFSCIFNLLLFEDAVEKGDDRKIAEVTSAIFYYLWLHQGLSLTVSGSFWAARRVSGIDLHTFKGIFIADKHWIIGYREILNMPCFFDEIFRVNKADGSF